jgi:hypothetical protein
MHTAKGIAELLHPQQPHQRNHQENLLHAHQPTPLPLVCLLQIGMDFIIALNRPTLLEARQRAGGFHEFTVTGEEGI